MSALATDVRGTARFSADGRHRFSLTRVWRPGPRVAWIMLNPSTASDTEDDPTLRRCTDFARRWGFGSLEVVNLFSLATPSPAALRAAESPVSAKNDIAVAAAIARAGLVLAAWGAAHRGLLGRAEAVRARLPVGTRCLGLTQGGDPRHPLYLPADTPLKLLPR